MLYKSALGNMVSVFAEIEGLMPGNVVESIEIVDDRGGKGVFVVSAHIAKPDGSRFIDTYEIGINGELVWVSLEPAAKSLLELTEEIINDAVGG